MKYLAVILLTSCAFNEDRLTEFDELQQKYAELDSRVYWCEKNVRKAWELSRENEEGILEIKNFIGERD